MLILEATGVAPRRGPAAVVGAAVNQDGRSSSPRRRTVRRSGRRFARRFVSPSSTDRASRRFRCTAREPRSEIPSRSDPRWRRLSVARTRRRSRWRRRNARRPHRDGGGRRRRRAAPREFGASRRRSRRAPHRGQRPRAERDSIGARRSRRSSAGDAATRRRARRISRGLRRDARVSGFAFQGTNGHVIARRVVETNERAGRVGGGAERSSADRARVLVVPETHASLRRARADGLLRDRPVFGPDGTHAHLWDHRVMRRALFPGAGLFELALCGAATMGGTTDATPRGSVALTPVRSPRAPRPRGSRIDGRGQYDRKRRGTFVVIEGGASSRRAAHLDARIVQLTGAVNAVNDAVNDADDDGKPARERASRMREPRTPA